MVNLDVVELRLKLDLDGKYVDFNLLRTTLNVLQLVNDLGINLTEPNKDGECRGICAKCGKERSFCLNVNTNRFNCFAKECNLKGGGVIDFFCKLYGVTAKEASHLIAYIYAIEPYAERSITKLESETKQVVNPTPSEKSETREVISRREFDALNKKVEGLMALVCSIILEKDLFDSGKYPEVVEHVSKLKQLDKSTKA